MVKNNLKKLMAFALATSMILGSSVTAFAATADGAGSYEGDDVGFAAATSLTVPETPTTGFAYIADPNGLIKESAASHYPDSTWADTAKGVFFKTEVKNNKTIYSEKSATLEVVNNNAAPIIVSAKLKKADGTAAVAFNPSATFGEDTNVDKEVYMAITDGTTTKAIPADGSEVEIPIGVAGKIANYSLAYDNTNNVYAYTLNNGITLTDASKWNKTSFYVTGALNQRADWSGGAAVTFPKITVTWAVTAGAVPLKIKSGKAGETSLTYKADTTIKQITVGETVVNADTLGRTNPSAAAAGKITVTAAQAKTLYDPLKSMKDGLTMTVEYNDGYTELVTIFAR